MVSGFLVPQKVSLHLHDVFKHFDVKISCECSEAVLQNSSLINFSTVLTSFSAVNGDTAGPSIISPVYVNLEPWHGQSHDLSAEFQLSSQPIWVHVVLTRKSLPCSSRYAPVLSPSFSKTFPSPGSTFTSSAAVPFFLISGALQHPHSQL